MLKGIANNLVRFVQNILAVTIATGGYISINSKRIYVFSTAITGNSTAATSIPDGSIALTTHATGRSKVFVAVSSVWQEFAVLAYTPATTITALTDSTGGTGNNTLQAIPVITDSPASADALRDDIVTNVVPVLNNNFADLSAKLNEVIANLKTNGVIASS
jgi:hypothetical protein